MVATFSLTNERRPERSGPLPDSLARLLPLIYTLRHFAGRTAEQVARRHHPELAALADDLGSDTHFDRIRTEGSLNEALNYLRL